MCFNLMFLIFPTKYKRPRQIKSEHYKNKNTKRKLTITYCAIRIIIKSIQMFWLFYWTCWNPHTLYDAQVPCDHTDLRFSFMASLTTTWHIETSTDVVISIQKAAIKLPNFIDPLTSSDLWHNVLVQATCGVNKFYCLRCLFYCASKNLILLLSDR